MISSMQISQIKTSLDDGAAFAEEKAKALLKLKNEHEKGLLDLEFKNKVEWENLIHNLKINNDYEKFKKEILEEVNKKQTEPRQIDLNRVAMIHLLLSGSNYPITAENLDIEIKKVEKIYQLLKDKIS